MSILDRIPDEASAYAYLEELRWGESPECGHCGSDNIYLIIPSNGVSRKTRTGTLSERRVWKCRACAKQFSVLTGTVFHRSKVPMRVIVRCLYEMCLSKNGVAAREVVRKYGTCPRTAWYVTQRIREAMRNDGPDSLRGTIVADEAWMGGDPTKDTRLQAKGYGRPVVPGQNARTDKQPIQTIVSKETGEVRTRVIPNATGATLQKVLAEHVDAAGSVLHTDSNSAYNAVGRQFVSHETVNHLAGEYVRGNVSTNQVEGFFSQLKRSVSGTHHSVSKKHLHRYLSEFDYR
jgi:transposase-like protein